MSVRTNAIQRVVLGLTKGGQIGMPIIEDAVKRALDTFYESTEILKLELDKISEVEGTSEYAFPALVAEADGRVCRVDKLYRLAYNSSDVETSRTLLSPHSYAVGLTAGETATLASISEVLALSVESPATVTDSLLIVGVMAFRIDNFIPSMHLADAEAAVAAKAIQEFAMNTGKPWSDPRKALVEEENFNAAVRRIRNKALRENTGRELAMTCPNSFI